MQPSSSVPLPGQEDPVTATVRARAAQDDPPDLNVAGLLAWSVIATAASSVVEFGSAGGVSGRWLAGALPARGTLTTIEPDAERLQRAQAALSDTSARVRSIMGQPEDVLGRMAEQAYDVVLLQTPMSIEHLPGVLALLRPAGWLILRRPDAHVLRRPSDPTLAEVLDSAGFVRLDLSLDDGLLLATRPSVET